MKTVNEQPAATKQVTVPTMREAMDYSNEVITTWLTNAEGGLTLIPNEEETPGPPNSDTAILK